MKKNLLTLLAACLLAGACQPRCEPDRLLEPDEIRGTISFALINRRTGQNIFPLFTNGNNFRIVDTQEVDYPLQFGANGIFDLINFLKKTPEDLTGLSTLASKTFYLRLSATDTDTIRFDFRLELDQCEEPRLSYREVWFNGDIVRRTDGDNIYKFLK
jgi:hypothetical protein